MICTGVVHHLTSPAEGIGRLRKICRDFLFLETMCIPETLVTPQMRRQMELKDLPYFFTEPFCGVSGHKLEAGYFDGSATGYAVVSYPTLSTLLRFVELQGFTDLKQPMEHERYANAVSDGTRNFAVVCLTASVDHADLAGKTARQWIFDYERGMLTTMLPEGVAAALAAEFLGAPKPARVPILARTESVYLRSSNAQRGFWLGWVNRLVSDRYQREILKNARYNRDDKLRIEYAKVLLEAGDLETAIAHLQAITRHLNADWRATYRAFCLLSWAYRRAVR